MKPSASICTLAARLLHVTVIRLPYQSALVRLGHRAAAQVRGVPGARRLVERLAGLALVGLGLRVAVDMR